MLKGLRFEEVAPAGGRTPIHRRDLETARGGGVTPTTEKLTVASRTRQKELEFSTSGNLDPSTLRQKKLSTIL